MSLLLSTTCTQLERYFFHRASSNAAESASLNTAMVRHILSCWIQDLDRVFLLALLMVIGLHSSSFLKIRKVLWYSVHWLLRGEALRRTRRLLHGP